MLTTGVVLLWDSEDGWGVIDSPETPGGCWLHFSALRANDRREPRPGQRVDFTFEPVQQGRYRFRALEVWPQGPEPGVPGDDPRHGWSQASVRWDADGPG